nr:trimeric intracellular cation channel family protein [uncultured Desulfobacter sp.]
MTEVLILLFDYLGTFAFAVSGALAAAEKKLDLFGAVFLGFVTAIGGGTTRDMMIGNTPVSWLQDPVYFYVIVAAVGLTFLFTKTIVRFSKSLFFFDTIGISVFTVIGIQKGLHAGIHPPLAVMMGILTAVMGGIIRDVLCNEIPLIFHKEIYATACFAGGVFFVLLVFINMPEPFTAFIAAGVIFTIRSLSVRKGWALPRFK